MWVKKQVCFFGGIAVCLSVWPNAILASPADQPGLLPGGAAPSAENAAAAGLGDTSAQRSRALALYYEGIKFALKGDPSAAIERYLEVLKLDPGHLALAKRLADTYVLAGQPNDALAVLENTVRANPDQPQAYIFLSEFCARQHNNSEAVRARAFSAAGEAVERFPGNAKAHANLAALLLFDNRRDEAAAVIERAAAREEPSARYWVELGSAATQVWPVREPAGREKVLALFRKALPLAGQDDSILEDVADFLATIREMPEAASLYQKVTAARPADLKAREKLGHALALAGKKDESAEAWQRLLEIDPQNAAAHEALARHFAEKGDVRASATHRAAALRWQGRETLGEALRLVRDMIQAGLCQEALPVLERAEFNAPGSPEPPYFAAIAHGQLKNHAQAVAAFSRAAAIAEGLDDAGAAFLQEGFYFEWAMACEQAGQLDEAEKHFRTAIERVPPKTPELAAKSYNALAYLWLEHDRRVDEAGPLIERALKFDPENAAYLDTQGWFYFKKGDFAKALELLRRAEAAAGTPIAEIIDHVAQAHWALGQKTEALAALERAAALPDATDAMKTRVAEWRAASQPAE